MKLPSLALVAALLAGNVSADEQQFVLRDHLNRKWQRQLVSFPFSATQGKCHLDSVALDGPAGQVPGQLSDVESWPGGDHFVKSARVWFLADLEARSARTYTLKYSADPAREGSPKSDLSIERQEASVEISTSAFGIRFPLGSQDYAVPETADKVPPPILAMRLADGTWFGGSRLYGGDELKSFSASLIAQGPVFAEMAFRYGYANGNVLSLKALVAAGDNAVLWAANVTQESPDSGWHLVLSRGLPALVFPVYMEWFTKRECFLKRKARVNELELLPLDAYPAGLVTKLTPWGDWFDDMTQTSIRLKVTGTDRELRLDSRDPGAWVEPAAPGTMQSGEDLWHKQVPLVRSDTGEVYLELNNAKGARKWAIGEHASPKEEPKSYSIYDDRFAEREFSAVGRRLDVIKDYVLEWESPKGRERPRLFMTEEEIQDIRKRIKPDPGVMSRAQWVVKQSGTTGRPNDTQGIAGYLMSGDPDLGKGLVERLKKHLDRLGQYDLMRNALNVVIHYDAVMDSPWTREEDKPLLRAQMAFLGYKLADPSIWSIERGYKSGNPNMSISYLLTLGMLACVIPDHPMAREWAQPAIDRMQIWLTETVGPGGSWHESSHYAHVSASIMVAFAIAARNAEFHDFFKEPELKRFMMYLAKNFTPPDPQRGNWRVTAPMGRSTAGERFGLIGAMARATAKTDPDYSKVAQWAWEETGYSRNVCDDRFGGFEYVYMDPDLPAAVPDWKTELFPRTNAVLRYGVGSDHEYYLNIFTANLEPITRASEPGAVLKLFAKGRPVGGCFTGGYNERQELLTSRVLLARSWRPDHWSESFGYDGKAELAGFSALPRMDYLCVDIGMYRPMDTTWYKASIPKGLPPWPSVKREAEPPVDWRRQIAFVKDDSPAGVNYLVFRDTIASDQPTMWQFWTLSEKVGTPEDVMHLDAFLADKPGKGPASPRRLKGDRFTAIGQSDLDTEYFVALPKRTPRHTLRFGDRHEHMDLLHLQLHKAGAYFVALYPRLRDEPVPVFTELGKGEVIRISGEFGTDYVFLSAEEDKAKAGDAVFEGTAASVQDRRTGLGLSLGAKGRVKYRDFELAADGAVSMRLSGEKVAELSLPPDHKGTEITLKLPGTYRLTAPTRGVKLSSEGAVHTLTIPAGVGRAVLEAE